MKLTITKSFGEVYGERDLQGISYELETEDNKNFGASFQELTECPEDATFDRDLSSALVLDKVIKAAYEAGKRGETLEIEEDEEDW